MSGGFENKQRDGCDWEIIDRWLAFPSIVSASIRLAMKRSRSGLIVRSSVETELLRGFDRVALPVNREESHFVHLKTPFMIVSSLWALSACKVRVAHRHGQAGVTRAD
jgi:hypothetical protein